MITGAALLAYDDRRRDQAAPPGGDRLIGSGAPRRSRRTARPLRINRHAPGGVNHAVWLAAERRARGG
jgi:hypothetical protein